MAPHAPDPHNLRKAAKDQKAAAPIIETDRPCQGCGYNLRGLRLGINCPECGLPSVMEEVGDDPLSHMPMRVILTLVRGCWVASICVVLMVAVVLIERFQALDHSIAMLILAGLSFLWVGAAWWLTPAFTIKQAMSRGFGPRSRTRTAARWLQWGWVLATGCAAATSFAPGFEDLLSVFQMIGLLMGLSGLVVLSILMEHLAEWARDEDAQRMFNWAMWSWPIAMLLYVPLQGMVSVVLAGSGRPMWGTGMFILLWIVAIGTFPYGLLTLAKSVTLSVLHAAEYKDRLVRRDERTRKYHGQVADTVQRMDSSRAAAAKSKLPGPMGSAAGGQPSKPRQTPTKP